MNKKITNSLRWRFLAIIAALYLGALIPLYLTVPADKRPGSLIVLVLLTLPFALIGFAGGLAQFILVKKRPGLGLAYSVCMISVSFMLTPFILHAEVPKMPEFVFWYLVTTGFLGLLGLLWLFIWYKRGSN